MSSVYHRVDKRTGNTYAYESTSYREEGTGRVRTRQTYLGRVDPLTGELIPKGQGGRRSRAPSDRAIEETNARALARIAELEGQVEALASSLEAARSEIRDRDERMRAVLSAVEGYLTDFGPGMAEAPARQ